MDADTGRGVSGQPPDYALAPASWVSKGERLLEILPGSSFGRVRNPASFWLAWLIDVCAEHGDNRQAIFTEASDGWLNANFFDFGHFFGGPKGDGMRNLRASRYLDSRIYVEVSSETLLDFERVIKAADSDRLWELIEAIPREWKQDSAVDGFERCLQKTLNATLCAQPSWHIDR